MGKNSRANLKLVSRELKQAGSLQQRGAIDKSVRGYIGTRKSFFVER